LTFVKAGQLDDALGISEMLLGDKHDLIHKAVGWVLRESGKVSRSRLLRFIAEHYRRIPRTSLRYAIEHFSPGERKLILAGDLSKLEAVAEKRKDPPMLTRRRVLQTKTKTGT
jgi:hypothetical protein